MNQALYNQIGEGWYNHLSPYLESSDFSKLIAVLKKKSFAPYAGNVFRAFQLTPWEDVKVVILGQDPYHTVVKTMLNKAIPQATGLAFGIPKNTTHIPPSLRNIKLELEGAFEQEISKFDYSLEPWAKQGVLLLNTALTVAYGKPGSHTKMWQAFTKQVISSLSENKPGLIWLLWGGHAKSYKKYINEKSNIVLESAHPSPLSANRGGWFGHKHFVKVNSILDGQNGKEYQIRWFQ